jgi:UPF0042 nucleotide-binding protein
VQRLIIITGLSGSGKTLAVRAFEDMGYFCVDNLPIRLIPIFSELLSQSQKQIITAAIVVDIREGAFLQDFPVVMEKLKNTGYSVEIIFFKASMDVLKRRFSETRRPHPLAQGMDLDQGIKKEIEIMKPIREAADTVIDTSTLTIHEFRQFLRSSFMPSETTKLNITLISFGYKYGIPTESDLIFDVRFLPNPFFIEDLKAKTGLDQDIISYLNTFPAYEEFLKRTGDLITFLLPEYIKEGKSYLTISVGCTGGRHRSVSIIEALNVHLEEKGFSPKIIHRDIEK